MNLTPHQKRQLTLVLVLLFGIPATVFLVFKGIQYLANAGSDATPRNVFVSNITTSSLTISWVTEKKVDGYVVPIQNETELEPVTDYRGEGKRSTHYVVLKSLEPSTEYKFIILSDGKKYKNDTKEFKFTTPAVSESVVSPKTIFGSIGGEKFEDAILYVLFSDKSAYPVSSPVPSSGNWTGELSTFRKISDKSSLQITEDTQLVVLAMSGLDVGGVLEGAYSALFNGDGKLNGEVVMEKIEDGKLVEYFPDIANLGNTKEIVIPEGPEEPEKPATPVVPVQPQSYVVRKDVIWKSLVGSGSVTDMDTGEDTVTVTNLSDTYAVISWRSAQKEEGYVKYGTSKTEINEEIIDSRDSLSEKGEYYSHYIETNRLEPDTTYYFVVYSGSKVYDNDGAKFTLKTYSTLSSAPPLETRIGKIINSSELSDWVLVGKVVDNDELGTIGSSGYVSVLPDTNGTWELIIGDVRSQDGSSYFSFSDADILQIYVLGADSYKYDFNLSLDEIQLDMSKLGSSVGGKVKLLTDYGIFN
jgi:hypothetical protein